MRMPAHTDDTQASWQHSRRSFQAVGGGPGGKALQ